VQQKAGGETRARKQELDLRFRKIQQPAVERHEPCDGRGSEQADADDRRSRLRTADSSRIGGTVRPAPRRAEPARVARIRAKNVKYRYATPTIAPTR